MERADGKRGEKIALQHLLRRGLRLRERNWRCGHLELDLVMEDDSRIHIIEVRSRTAPYLISPLESVDRTKQRKIIRAASAYVKRYRIRKEVVFDIVSITYFEDKYNIEYYEGAFFPLYI